MDGDDREELESQKDLSHHEIFGSAVSFFSETPAS